MHRDNMCNKILEFSQICEENNEFVSNWIDNVAIEGIKDVYLQKIKNNFNIKIICEKAKELLFHEIMKQNEYLASFTYNGNNSPQRAVLKRTFKPYFDILNMDFDFETVDKFIVALEK